MVHSKKYRLFPVLYVPLLIILLLGFTGCSQTTTSSKKDVKIGYYGGTCEAAIYAAYEKGIFKQKGIDVELVKLNNDTLKENLATGKVDALQVSPGLFKPIEQGLNIKLTNGVHTGCIQGVAPTNSNIRSLKDLKGKVIGVDAIGGVPMTLLSVELGKLGIKPDKDVQWKAFPSPQLPQVLEKGEIDAFATWDPFGQISIDSGKTTRIFSSTHDPAYKDILCCFIGINGQVVQKNPETAKAITDALVEAAQWVGQHPKEAAQIAVDKKYTGGDVETAAKLLADYQFQPDLTNAKKSLTFYLNSFKDQKILDPSTDPTKLVDHIFVDVSK